MENSYESLTTLPLQSAQSSTQPTTMQSYWQNNYIHSFSPISQLTQTPIDSSYVYFTNTTPYYSNAAVQLDNFPPDQNSYSFAPHLSNANSFSAISTTSTRTSTSSAPIPSSSSRQQENKVYYV
ncbi:hypothetical protein RclHR1_36160001 [Rhizophagus clarus]|nr:hypothetical protein RclHR1_36160001 [Rhizophagus clarus]